jgi:hypothetical protein
VGLFPMSMVSISQTRSPSSGYRILMQMESTVRCNVRLNWNIESDMNVNWIKFKNFLSLYCFKNKQH